MFTLCIRDGRDPNKLAEFQVYCESEQDLIRRVDGKIVGCFLVADYAGPTNEAYSSRDQLPASVAIWALTSWPKTPTVLKVDDDHGK
jgi:hypothetical protein